MKKENYENSKFSKGFKRALLYYLVEIKHVNYEIAGLKLDFSLFSFLEKET